MSCTVNGTTYNADVEPRVMLAEWLRGLGMTGTHLGCDTTSCGACTVLVEGLAVKSCTMLAVQADGAAVTTIEGVGTPQAPSEVQAAFMAEHGLQCGFCTPGFVMAATALLAHDANPTDAAIERALEGNLCRCTGYTAIMHAVRRAATIGRGEVPLSVAGVSHDHPLLRHEVHSGPAHEDLDDTEVV